MMTRQSNMCRVTKDEFDRYKAKYDAAMQKFFLDLKVPKENIQSYAVDVSVQLKEKCGGSLIIDTDRYQTFDEVLKVVYRGMNIPDGRIFNASQPTIRDTIVPRQNIAYVSIRMGFISDRPDDMEQLPGSMYYDLFELAAMHDFLSKACIIPDSLTTGMPMDNPFYY